MSDIPNIPNTENCPSSCPDCGHEEESCSQCGGYMQCDMCDICLEECYDQEIYFVYDCPECPECAQIPDDADIKAIYCEECVPEEERIKQELRWEQEDKWEEEEEKAMMAWEQEIEQRGDELYNALLDSGIQGGINMDIRMCRKYVFQGEGSVDYIVTRLKQLKFLFEYHNMKEVIKQIEEERYKQIRDKHGDDCDDHYYDYYDFHIPAFEEAEYRILCKTKGYPKVFPWQKKFMRFRKVTGAKDTCPICYDKLGDCIRMICKHTFHKKCISKWLLKRPTCPCCRKQIATEKEQPNPQNNPNVDNDSINYDDYWHQRDPHMINFHSFN
jgi:hypothetical protein